MSGQSSSGREDLQDGSADPPWSSDVDNPFNWSSTRKWTIFSTLGLVCMAAGLNATAYATPGHQIAEEFGVSDGAFPNSYWPIAAWIAAAGVGPMIGIPLMENFGTRPGYLVVYFIFTVFLVPQAASESFAALVVTRAVSGIFGGILGNVAESFIADMFFEEERDLPVTIFVLLYEAGFTLGPAWGAMFPLSLWRWSSYTLLILFGVFSPVLFVVLRETRRPIIVRKRTSHKRSRGGDLELHAPRIDAGPDTSRASPTAEPYNYPLAEPSLKDRFYEAIIRPAKLLSTEGIVIALTTWCAFCVGLVFISTQSIEIVFSTNYKFSERQIGVVQVTLFVGECLGFICCLIQNTYYHRSKYRNRDFPDVITPEARLLATIPASFIGLTGGLFWYAWASTPRVHWVLPMLGLVFVGVAIMIIVNSAVLYLTDAYTVYAGSAAAAIAFGENLFAAWLPFSTGKMYEQLGFRWAGSLLGFVALILSFVPVILVLKGKSIRAKSPIAKKMILA